MRISPSKIMHCTVSASRAGPGRGSRISPADPLHPLNFSIKPQGRARSQFQHCWRIDGSARMIATHEIPVHTGTFPQWPLPYGRPSAEFSLPQHQFCGPAPAQRSAVPPIRRALPAALVACSSDRGWRQGGRGGSRGGIRKARPSRKPRRRRRTDRGLWGAVAGERQKHWWR